MRVFINYKQNVAPDHDFARAAESALRDDGHQVFRDESGLVPSQKWAARLEQEVRACDAMLSIVSNAALRSPWFLNEIDLAIKLEKRIVPILLEEIDESLDFQAFRPRFGGTQWLKASGDQQTDCAELVRILRETRHQCYHDLIEAKLTDYGAKDGREILEALCGPLYQSHWPFALARSMADASSVPEEGLQGTSLAEELRNEVSLWASAVKHNADVRRKSGDEARSKLLTWQAQRLLFLKDVLDTLIGAWDRNLARRAYVLQHEKARYVFDDSDGEQAFASEYADTIHPRAGRVPADSIVRVIDLGKMREDQST